MTSAVAVEDLFAVQRSLDGSPGQHRQLGSGGLVLKQLQLATEAAANRRSDHAHLVLTQLERLGQLLVDVMRRLRAAPQGEFPDWTPIGHTRVLLERQMCVALEEVRVFEDM